MSEEFLTRERLRERPEVHVAGLCVHTPERGAPRVLLARRVPTRALFPGKLEGCGGQLRAEETFVDGVERHFRLEMGIRVRVLQDIHCFYVISEPSHPLIPGIRFLCERADDVEPKSNNHSELLWVTEKELKAIPANDFVGNLKEEALQLLARYKQGEH